MLYWNDNVYLMRIDSLTIWWLMYMLVHLHKHTHGTLPRRAWNDWFVATPWWWVASVWVAWQTRSARTRVGSDVSICTIEIEWHDRRGQHGCLLDRIYAPIQKYDLLRKQAGNVWTVELWNEFWIVLWIVLGCKSCLDIDSCVWVDYRQLLYCLTKH